MSDIIQFNWDEWHIEAKTKEHPDRWVHISGRILDSIWVKLHE